jgi:hypothetical protein
VRSFYDLAYTDVSEDIIMELGYTHVFSAKNVRVISGKKGAARKEAARARNEGKIPVYIARTINDAKEASWVENSIMDIRAKIDMQVANIMREKHVVGMITLKWLRDEFSAPRFASEAVRILHKARVPLLLASGAEKTSELRAPRDIAAVGKMLGMTIPMALAAVSDNWRFVYEG